MLSNLPPGVTDRMIEEQAGVRSHRARRPSLRTCTVMTYAAGDTGETSYAVMRGPMRGKVFYSHEAEIVGRYTLQRGEQPDYVAMSARHATEDAPPVYWQR